jgi:hypothetical protein
MGRGDSVHVGQYWYLLYDEQVIRMRVTHIHGDRVVLTDAFGAPDTARGTKGCVRVLSTSIAGLKSAALDDRANGDVTADLPPTWDDTTVSERPRGLDDDPPQPNPQPNTKRSEQAKRRERSE